MTTLVLEPVDLAALLCSRVCHDVISPVGAIVNGLEVLEDEDDPAMREVAIELIKKSAHSASARLQFCRLAFGAAGSVGASIDTGDAESVARGLIASERTTLVWNATRQLLAKNKVKLLLNLCLVASATIPRGGVMTVDLSGEGDSIALQVAVKAREPALGERRRRAPGGPAGKRQRRRAHDPTIFRGPRGTGVRDGGGSHDVARGNHDCGAIEGARRLAVGGAGVRLSLTAY